MFADKLDTNTISTSTYDGYLVKETHNPALPTRPDG
ncbi:hypothetical protein NBRC106471_2447 [Acetobacter pasteurianus subsp. pasteurianus LMG 1262 = NBRC 106471]|uniref:Uncharacterized protein n=1 Tax=Acetobacter pasteurianus NBRC 3188 TaxID=1226663 RepID=A0A401WZ74_ACEPA|nr:hypothetical protein NBRC106471_2447 [Acetobacter pasteurianus subsp. pasteurianus LMG 1262 = NBRC 106471]GCD54659.1 hypothetical protein NBRC3188_3356 [Acetobacter pasteurianus NBRC 3188]